MPLRSSTFALVALCAMESLPAPAESWKAGAARVDITPKTMMWMSGYASRDKPAEGVLHPLWAKALIIEDPRGERLCLVTLDLVGIGRPLSVSVCAEIASRYELPRDRVALCCSHTHTGPVVGDNLRPMLFLSDEQLSRVDAYTVELKENIVDAVGKALETLAPARLNWGVGHASFAVNRRNNTEADVPALRAAGELAGPVDHDVPVLSVRGEDDTLRALVFGYACHATVLSYYQFTGDYPGFAQIHLEAMHPDAIALFFAGCGGDQNPLPRREVEQADRYGRLLAEAVDRVISAPMQMVEGGLAARYQEIDLPLDTLPTRDDLERDAQSDDRYVAARAQYLLSTIDSGTPLSATYPYPVQSWQLGNDLLWVFLGGEVVVDYSLRLKLELGRGTTWVAGYSNDVMAYIPSRRVLTEGGYEGGGAMVYYGLPTVWAPHVEETLVKGVHAQAESLRAAR